MHTFETKRLHCRLIKDSDKRFVASLYTSASQMKFIDKPMSESEASAVVDKMLQANANVKQSAYWLMTEKSSDVPSGEPSGEPAGIVSITRVKSFVGVAEIGIMLARHAEGKHYPYEAFSGLFDYVFQHLDIDLLIEMHQQANRPVTRFLKRLGFSENTICEKEDACYFLSVLNKKDWLT